MPLVKLKAPPLHFAPEGVQADLDTWISSGVLPDDNDLLIAILRNDLAAVVGLSGSSASFWPKVRAVKIWLWNFAPPKSYGSVEKVEAWVRRGGLERKVLQ